MSEETTAPKKIDYYFAPNSPWSYLGHDRLAIVAKKHRATIDLKPVDYAQIFPVTGGLPVAKRAPARQQYRLVELARWRKHNRLQLTVEPKYFPYDPSLASLLIVAAKSDLGQTLSMLIASAIFKGCWVEERDMADPEELYEVVKSQGLNTTELLASARSDETRARYQALTDEALERGVFGAPTYFYKDELFWGQDRLDFLDLALTD
jgi:2-hydroxychromene-2-carboxylate isomerase